MEPHKTTISVSFDFALFEEKLKNIKDFENDEQLFQELAGIASCKREIDEFLDEFANLERSVKQAINDRAKALFGDKWAAIRGNGYKITRSMAGSVYDVDPKSTNKKFLVTSYAPNTDAIKDYVREKNKLPKGVEFNPNRTEVIRINVKEDVQN